MSTHLVSFTLSRNGSESMLTTQMSKSFDAAKVQ